MQRCRATFLHTNKKVCGIHNLIQVSQNKKAFYVNRGRYRFIEIHLVLNSYWNEVNAVTDKTSHITK